MNGSLISSSLLMKSSASSRLLNSQELFSSSILRDSSRSGLADLDSTMFALFFSGFLPTWVRAYFDIFFKI